MIGFDDGKTLTVIPPLGKKYYNMTINSMFKELYWGMENWTFDHKRGFGLATYFVPKEDFSQKNNSMLKLVHIREGNGTLRLNNEKIIFSAPALLCLNEQDEVELQQSCNLTAQSVYFHPTVINDTLQIDKVRNANIEMSLWESRDYFLIIPFIERAGYSRPCMEIGPIASNKVSRLFNSMREEIAVLADYWPCRYRSFLLEILFLIQNMITDPKTKAKIDLPEPTEEIADIILYLHANYDKRITIDELTDSFHINRTTLSAKFRQSIGLSIIEYLIKYRIKVAATMLRDTNLPVAEILTRVGFKDSGHFCRMFKKHTGRTPSSYREQLAINNLLR